MDAKYLAEVEKLVKADTANAQALATLKSQYEASVKELKDKDLATDQAIADLDAKYLAELKALEDSITAANNQIIANKAALEIQISDLKAQTTQKINALQALIDALESTDNAQNEEIEILKQQVEALLTETYYTVTFNTNGGGVINSQYVAEGRKIEKPEDPVKPGYYFDGWFCGDEKWAFSGYVVTENITLTANWIPNVYRLTLNVNGGVCSDEYVDVTFDASYTLPEPTRVGYTFAGWWNGGDQYPNGHWVTPNAIELTAQWTANTDTDYVVKHYRQNITDDGYTLVAFNELEGTSDASITPVVNTYTGFTSPATQTTTIKPDGTTIVEYRYTRNSYTITYVVNGGEEIATESLKYQANISLGTTTRTNYTFGGWFADKSLATEYTTTTMPATNQTVYAWWSEENKPTDFTYSGASAITVSAYNGTSTTMWIPAYIGGVPITTIPASAFKDQATLLKVVVPDTVTEIGDGAFKGCNEINDITLPFVGKTANATYTDAVFGYIFGQKETRYSTTEGLNKVDYNFYDYCPINNVDGVWQYTNYTYYYSPWKEYQPVVYHYYIPETIQNVTITVQTEIPIAAFNNCDFIENITLPTKVISIGAFAFADCISLFEVQLPSEVASIGDYAFNACTQLNEVKFTENSKLKTIGAYAFADCISLFEMQLPSEVASIGDYAFNACAQLEEVKFTENSKLKTIGNYAFSGCISVAKVGSQEEGEMLLPENLVTIGEYAFQNLLLIGKIVVPESVTSIGEGAFKGCDDLKDITLPFVGGSIDATKYKSVLGYIFGNKVVTSTTGGGKQDYFVNKIFASSSTGIWQYSCSGSAWGNGYYDQNSYYYYIPTTIRNVTITVQTEIPIAAFNNCDFIESITLPTTVTSIGEYAFQNCSALKRLSSKVDGEFILPIGINVIGTNTFTNCEELVKVVIPANVTNIGANAFQVCSQLTDVDFADGSQLKSVGAYAFEDCISLSEVQLPNSVTSIGNYAFSGCISIAKFNSQVEGELIVPENTVTIGEYAFQNLGLITKVVVPDAVTSIGLGAFKGCNEIKDITLPFVGKSVDATYNDAVFGYIFDFYITTAGTLVHGADYNYVNEVYGYRPSGTIWQFSNHGVFHSSGYYDYNKASWHYYIPTTIRNVTITVQTEMPTAAFNNCDFIESITLPATVTSIGDYAFQNCSANILQTYIPTLSYWNGTDIASTFIGEGSENSPYQINTAADLAYLSNSVNTGENYQGKYFILNVNINLNSKSWTPIGTKTYPFAGIFNGNGKVVSNLSINADTAYAGLFGYVSGTIKNLGIESGAIKPKSTAASTYAGGIAGYVVGRIENCYSNANITISTANIVYSGGLVGYVDSGAIVKNCYASGNISLTTTTGFAYAGGFVGSNKGTIEKSLAFGNVTAKGQNDTYSRNGGFVAANSGILSNCYRSDEQVLTKYTVTGTVYCDDGIVATKSEMLAFAKDNWDSSVWEFEAEYPVFE